MFFHDRNVFHSKDTDTGSMDALTIFTLSYFGALIQGVGVHYIFAGQI